MTQKFNPGDFVKISKTLPKNMSHFESGCVACIEGSYADLYGGERKSPQDYALIIFRNRKPTGSSAWYPEKVLEKFDSYNLMNYFKGKD